MEVDLSRAQPLSLAARWALLDLERRQGTEGAQTRPDADREYWDVTSAMLDMGLLKPTNDGTHVLSWVPAVSMRVGLSFLTVACAVGSFLAPMVGVGAALDSSSGAVGPILLTVGLITAPVLLFIAVRACLCGLRADIRGVTLVNMFNSDCTPWNELLDVQFSPVEDARSGELRGYSYDLVTSTGGKPSWVSRDDLTVSERMKRDRALLLAMKVAATHSSDT